MVKNRSRKPAPDEALGVATIRWARIFREALVVTGRSVSPTLVKLGVLDGNPYVTVHTFDMSKSSVDLQTIEQARTALCVVGHYDILDVRRSYQFQNRIDILTAQTPDLPENVLVDYLVMDSTPGFRFATGTDNSPVAYDPEAHGNLHVAGVASSGKTTFLQGLVIAATRRGHEVHVSEVPGRGTDFSFLATNLASLGTSAPDVLSMLKRVQGEIERRQGLLHSYQVNNLQELPASVQVRPVLVIIDEFPALIPEDSRVVTRWGVEENKLLTEIVRDTATLGRTGRALGVTLVICSQQLDRNDLRRVPEASDLFANCSNLLLGVTTPLSRMMSLTNEQSAPPLGEDVPAGRGIFEPHGGPGVPVQCWHDPGWGSAVQQRQSQVVGAVQYNREPLVAIRSSNATDHGGGKSRTRMIAEERVAHLNLPTEVRNFAYLESGLVVVAGTGRVGKSHTLAALGSLAAANIKANGDRVTAISCERNLFESPLLDEDVDHRGAPVENYTACIRAAVGTRSKVLLVDERVTPEAFEAALDAANAGVLVFISMHLPQVPIFDYVEAAYPPERQREMQSKAAAGMRACIHQHLAINPDRRRKTPEFRISANKDF